MTWLVCSKFDDIILVVVGDVAVDSETLVNLKVSLASTHRHIIKSEVVICPLTTYMTILGASRDDVFGHTWLDARRN